MLELILIIVAVIIFVQISKLIKRVDHLERMLQIKPAVAEWQQPLQPETTVIIEDTFQTAESKEPETFNAPLYQERPAQHVPPQQKHPRQSNSTSQYYEKLIAWGQQLLSGNIIAKIGGLIFIVGMAFLLKYAAQYGLLPIGLRLIAAAIVSLLLIAGGWMLRKRNENYALILQGIGISLIYIVIFISFRLYSLLPTTFAFALLIIIGLFAAILSILQNSRALIVLAQIGGFLAPILASSPQGDYIILFSYYAILNAAIGVIAWFKSWRLLNLIGFAFTFVIAIAWGVLRYTPVMYLPIQCFLIYFIVLYVAIALLFAQSEQSHIKRYIDGTLVFGVPLIGFGLQLAIVRNFHYGAAFSAIAFAAFYLLICWIVSLRGKLQQLLSESFLAIAAIFITLAIPLGLSEQWTGLTWAIEGCLIIWIGCRQQRLLYRFAGYSLTLIAGLIYLFLLLLAWRTNIDLLVHGNIIGIAGLAGCYLLQCQNPTAARIERFFSYLLFIVGTCCFYFSTFYYFNNWALNYLLIYYTIAALAASLIAVTLRWKLLQYLASAIIVYAWYQQTMQFADMQVFHISYLIAWLLCSGSIFFLLYQSENERLAINNKLIAVLHAFNVWLLLWWVANYVFQLIQNYFTLAVSWQYASMAVIPLAATWLIMTGKSAQYWPIKRYKTTYQRSIALVNLLALSAWSLLSNIHFTGTVTPLPYLPLLNPIDLVMLAILLLSFNWLQQSRHWLENDIEIPLYLPQIFIALLTLFWITCMVLRSVHQWANIPYNYADLYDATVAQAAVSITWVISGLILMFLAYFKQHRATWILGGCLLILVVGKLFLIDLSHTQSLARIISFITVGVVLLIIGYIAPIPPRQLTHKDDDHEN